jgi:hypothetical protein
LQEAEVKEQSQQISSLQALVYKLENDIKTLRRDNHLSRMSQKSEESKQHNPGKELPHEQSTHGQCLGLPTLSAIEGVMGKLTGLVCDMTSQILKEDKQRWYRRQHQPREDQSRRDPYVFPEHHPGSRDPYVLPERHQSRRDPYVFPAHYADNHQYRYSPYDDHSSYREPRHPQRYHYDHREVTDYHHTSRAAVYSDIAGGDILETERSLLQIPQAAVCNNIADSGDIEIERSMPQTQQAAVDSDIADGVFLDSIF